MRNTIGTGNTPRGFTLLELLAVITIIAILSAASFKIYGGIIQNVKKARARLQVLAIAEAANQYYRDLKVFPPDTGAYEPDDLPPPGLDSTSCKYAIHRYLGMHITDMTTGQQFGPYLQDISEKTLSGTPTTVDTRDNVQLYTDPWGNPYELDCKHWTRDPTTRVVTQSLPYPAGTPDDQTTLEVKAWSKGPDAKSSEQAQFYPLVKNQDDADNIMSWTKGN